MNRARDPWPPPKKTAARENLGGQLKTVLGGSGRSKHSTRRDGQGEREFQVWTLKFDGTSRLYQAYGDRPTAELVAGRLREIGMPCEVRRTGGAAP